MNGKSLREQPWFENLQRPARASSPFFRHVEFWLAEQITIAIIVARDKPNQATLAERLKYAQLLQRTIRNLEQRNLKKHPPFDEWDQDLHQAIGWFECRRTMYQVMIVLEFQRQEADQLVNYLTHL